MTAEPAPQQTENAIVPAEPGQADPNSSEPVESFVGQPENAGVDEPKTSAVQNKPKTAPKVAKAAEPAKTPQTKKVTVDDLINDN
jgi:hypothetical protein